MSTIIIGAVIFVYAGYVIIKRIKEMKRGKFCNCGCNDCSTDCSGICHKKETGSSDF